MSDIPNTDDVERVLNIALLSNVQNLKKRQRLENIEQNCTGKISQQF